MRRDSKGHVATWARWVLVVVLAAGCAPPTDYDLVIQNGWIVDGTGNPRFRGDVAIRGGRIVAVGRIPVAGARRTLDATGLIVAPGFIDMLGWSDIKVLADGRAASKVYQGITTEITGEGSSVAPQTDATIAQDSAYYRSLGVTVDWHDLDGYFRRLESSGSAINLATFVGATQVRMAVIGNDDRPPNPDELARMVALVDTAMRQGALGLSGRRRAVLGVALLPDRVDRAKPGEDFGAVSRRDEARVVVEAGGVGAGAAGWRHGRGQCSPRRSGGVRRPGSG